MSECQHRGCDEPALEGSEYCIFHKPDKSEEEAREFYSRIRQEAREPEGEIESNFIGEKYKRWVFKEECNWRRYCFPKIPKVGKSNQEFFTFKNSKFLSDVALGHSKFEDNISFANAEFSGEVFWADSKFIKRVNFNECDFKNSTNFYHVNFVGNANFGKTNFRGGTAFSDARFWAGGDFKNAKFYENVDLVGVRFNKGATFLDAEFHGKVDFKKSWFDNFGDFKNARFNGDVLYKYAIFDGFANFEGADFLGKVKFHRSIFFRDLDLGDVDFERRPKFISDMDELDLGVTYIGQNIPHSLWILETINPEIHSITIRDSDNSDEVYKSRKKATNKLKKLKKSENGLVNTKFIIEKFTQPKAKAEACREQRLTYESKGKKEEADQVYVHEMRARRETKDSQLQQFIDWLIADWTCKYGTSWQRVLQRSGQFIFGFTFLYWYFSIISLAGVMRPYTGTLISKGESIVTQRVISLFTGFGNSLYHSIITFTTIGYGDLNPSGLLMKIVSAVESAIGALFVALIIVVFARKWMRG